MQSQTPSPFKLKMNFFQSNHLYSCGSVICLVDHRFHVPARGNLGHLMVSLYQDTWVKNRPCQNSIDRQGSTEGGCSAVCPGGIGGFMCWTKQEQAWAQYLAGSHPHWYMVGETSGSASASGFSFPCVHFIRKQKASLGAENSGEVVGPKHLKFEHCTVKLSSAF